MRMTAVRCCDDELGVVVYGGKKEQQPLTEDVRVSCEPRCQRFLLVCLTINTVICSGTLHSQTRCAQRAQTSAKRASVAEKRGGALLRVSVYRIIKYMVPVMLRKVENDPCMDSDQHQNFITSRGSPLAHAYHIWSTSVNAFVGYLHTDSQTDKMTDRQTAPNT